MLRMWINQPSTKDTLHKLHGTRVLASPDTKETYRIYFLSGDVTSMQIPRSRLSIGWPRHLC